MIYNNIVEGEFILRPNRFIAYVKINGNTEICHVINTGRMRELLTPGATVFLQKASNPERKTKYDLISVKKDNKIVNIDSFAPNKIAQEFIPELFPDYTLIKPETVYGNSRFDFYIETSNDKIWLEVKGVTLKVGNTALFPDAPTSRGTKHLKELVSAHNEGYRAAILFVIAMEGIDSFSPNKETDPNFASALVNAKKNGAEIYAVSCKVQKDSIYADKMVPVILP